MDVVSLRRRGGKHRRPLGRTFESLRAFEFFAAGRQRQLYVIVPYIVGGKGTGEYEVYWVRVARDGSRLVLESATAEFHQKSGVGSVNMRGVLRDGLKGIYSEDGSDEVLFVVNDGQAVPPQ